MMVRYCERHRHAWPVASPWKPGEPCPFWAKVTSAAKGTDCEVKSVDAIAKINDLGFELEGRDEEERES
jgi:hypothetical protein